MAAVVAEAGVDNTRIDRRSHGLGQSARSTVGRLHDGYRLSQSAGPFPTGQPLEAVAGRLLLLPLLGLSGDGLGGPAPRGDVG